MVGSAHRSGQLWFYQDDGAGLQRAGHRGRKCMTRSSSLSDLENTTLYNRL